MKKKVISLLLCAAMVGTMLTGCGGSSEDADSSDAVEATEEDADAEEDAEEPAAADEEGTVGTNTFVDGGTPLELWTFQELHVDFYTQMADIWNEQNPDKPINLTASTGESSQVHTKLLVALQSGTGAPDICDVEIGHYATFLEDNYFLPLNDIVSQYEDDVVMSRITMYGKDDNYYGIDFHLGASVMYYNMDIMNEAGVDPATIVTWDDYVEAGKVVLEKTGKPMCAVEITDLFLPQLMLEEKGIQYVKDGEPDINTAEHAEVIEYIRDMMDLGICIVAPGGKVHTDEWYGFLNDAGVASIGMPLWYMGRFTDYCPDLAGKIAIYNVPVWNEGDVPMVLQGGTGTSVCATSEHADLAKEFLAWAKLSEEGNRLIWDLLGFDPINVSLWSDEEMTHNPDNKFVAYFQNNPFDALNAVKDEYGVDGLVAPDISGAYAATYSVLVSTTYQTVFESDTETPAADILETEQSTVIY